MGHEGHCKHVHGHNYVAFVTAEAEALDWCGRVIDFSVLKQSLGGWIEAYWDHSFIAYEQDKEVIDAINSVKGSPLFFLPCNPTAENMAEHLLRVVGPAVLENTGVRLVKVTLYETENCYAEATYQAAPANGKALEEEEDKKFVAGIWIDDPDEYFKLWGEYKASRKWALKKKLVAQRSAGICERCAKNAAREVHHKTYERRFDELLEDLEHLCRECHKYISGKSNHDPLRSA
jgi:6-pyruvoyltetrahydropterin/6-carboxytetrahydropterin synthase